jgi:hypothetical protein
MSELRDKLADIEHAQWAHWTKYMLDNLTDENIARWYGQIVTPFDQLSAKEQTSDYVWADRVLAILHNMNLIDMDEHTK